MNIKTAIQDTNCMADYLFIPIIILIFVTPIRVAFRSIFNSLRLYSASNLILLGFFLAIKIRFSIENGVIYYSINDKKLKEFASKVKNKKKPKFLSLLSALDYDIVNIKVKYGSNDNAMTTALVSSAIYNGLLIFSKVSAFKKSNIEVLSDYNTDILAIDIDIKTRIAVLQIIIAMIRILIRRFINGKHRKHHAGYSA